MFRFLYMALYWTSYNQAPWPDGRFESMVARIDVENRSTERYLVSSIHALNLFEFSKSDFKRTLQRIKAWIACHCLNFSKNKYCRALAVRDLSSGTRILCFQEKADTHKLLG